MMVMPVIPVLWEAEAGGSIHSLTHNKQRNKTSNFSNFLVNDSDKHLSVHSNKIVLFSGKGTIYIFVLGFIDLFCCLMVQEIYKLDLKHITCLVPQTE